MSEQTTILVVDDEEAIRFGLQLRLSGNGYQVLQAADGDEGVATAIKEKPQAIVMDVRMPRMDGISALRKLRSDPVTHFIPVVMLSASHGDRNVALDEGAEFFIHKPYSTDSLLVAIEAAVTLQP